MKNHVFYIRTFRFLNHIVLKEVNAYLLICEAIKIQHSITALESQCRAAGIGSWG